MCELLSLPDPSYQNHSRDLASVLSGISCQMWYGLSHTAQMNHWNLVLEFQMAQGTTACLINCCTNWSRNMLASQTLLQEFYKQ